MVIKSRTRPKGKKRRLWIKKRPKKVKKVKAKFTISKLTKAQEKEIYKCMASKSRRNRKARERYARKKAGKRGSGLLIAGQRGGRY